MTAHDSFCAQDVPVVGFMSGGMVIDTVSEGFCNYLNELRYIENQFASFRFQSDNRRAG